MRTLIALVLLLSLAASAGAAQSPEDAYAACVVGNAVVEMRHGKSVNDAAAVAWEECEPLAATVSENEAEGISDFVYSMLNEMAANGVELQPAFEIE